MNKPATSPLKLNHARVLDIANGNKAFLREYYDLARKLFSTLPQDFGQAAQCRDSEQIRRLAHSSRATIELLNIEPLVRLFEQLPSQPAEQLLSYCPQMEQICHEILAQLPKY